MGQNLGLLKYVGGVWFFQVYSQGEALGSKGKGGVYVVIFSGVSPVGGYYEVFWSGFGCNCEARAGACMQKYRT